MNTEEQSSTEKFTGTMQVQEKLKFPEKELECPQATMICKYGSMCQRLSGDDLG